MRLRTVMGSVGFLLAATQAMAMGPQTRHLRIVGAPDQGRTSEQLVKTVPAMPLSHQATDAASQEWLQTGVAPSLVGTNGQVMYPYGQSHPVITCAPLHICVISLMGGEHITNISIGDSVRWLVQPADAGNRPVVVVKPTDAGLVTNLVITTDAGRVYYLTLHSDAQAYVPQVGFYDPQKLVVDMRQDAQKAEAEQRAAEAAKKQAVVVPMGTIDPATLDFDFHCEAKDGHDGSGNLMPVRVFAGGGHTYLQMPATMKYTDAPAVFSVSGGQTELMNSRLVHGYYVIDGLPQEFKLVLGVGDHAQAVTCSHGEASGFHWPWSH